MKSLRLDSETSMWTRIFRVLGYSFIVMIFLGAFLAYGWLKALGVFNISDAEISGITQFRSADNSIVFDSEKKKIGEFFNRYHLYVPYEKIPKAFIETLLAIEDKNFFHHPGVDFVGMVRASYMSLRHGHYQQGASTITQQLVRHFVLSREKTIERKVREIALALKLEKTISKERILELYCNNLFLGNGAYGIGAAAKRYFGKSIDQLQLHELALIAGLFQSPSSYNPSRYPAKAKKRQKQVITALLRNKKITREAAITWLSKPLNYVPYKPMNERFAPYFIDFVREEVSRVLGDKLPENQGLRIYTTLESKLQTAANTSIQKADEVYERAENGRFRYHHNSDNIKKVVDDSPVEASLLSVDSRSGAILSMVGGRDYEKSKYNRTTQSQRSPGSAFKPIVYSLALQQGLTWAEQIYVTPSGVKNYRPKDFGNQDYLTESTLFRSFYKSMNSTTIHIGKKLQLPAILGYAKKLGIETPLKDEPGTMLGGSEVTMFDLARVYSVFSNYGRKPELHAVWRIEDRHGKILYQRNPKEHQSEVVISPQQAYLMTVGMQGVLKYGTAAKASAHSRYAAGKTGTSNDAKDNWFCGYTTNMTTIVWVGTDDQSPLFGKVTGGDLALPIWDDFMRQVANNRLRPLSAFSRPSGISIAHVHSQYGYQTPAGTPMPFLVGTAPVQTRSDLEVISATDNFRNVFGH